MERISSNRAGIRHRLLTRLQSAGLDGLEAEDLRHAYQLYDVAFFDGLLQRSLRERGLPLGFRLSRRMTRSAGRMGVRGRRRGRWHSARVEELEIALSSVLLLESWDGQPRAVNGHSCQDPLEALQLVLEHELLHLAEYLVWGQTRCSRPRFRAMARARFGHSASTHRLATPRQRASQQLGLRPGIWVAFQHAGQRHEGMINRITRRATVLVPNPQGRPYSDGGRYDKYYVPLERLSALSTPKNGEAHRRRSPPSSSARTRR